MSVETENTNLAGEETLEKPGQGEQVELIDVTSEDENKDKETEKEGEKTEEDNKKEEEKKTKKSGGFLARFKSPKRVKEEKEKLDDNEEEKKEAEEETEKKAEAEEKEEKKAKPEKVSWFARKKKTAVENAVENGGGVEGETKTTEGESEKKKKEFMTFNVNLVDRDDRRINDIVRIQFEDVIAEPETTHSIDCVWKITSKVFTCTQFWFYRLLTVFLGLPCGILWGVILALVTVLHIWLVRPFFKTAGIAAQWAFDLMTLFLDAIFTPCFKSCGAIFSNIRLQHNGTVHRIHEA